jgi:hypothetical protein
MQEQQQQQRCQQQKANRTDEVWFEMLVDVKTLAKDCLRT